MENQNILFSPKEKQIDSIFSHKVASPSSRAVEDIGLQRLAC